MFQRIKGAIDRTIAEEQARQKALDQAGTAGGSGTAQHRQSSSVSRSNSAASAAGKRSTPRQKKGNQDAPKDSDSKDADSTAANPDPSVFEAAFVIDDDEEPSRSATPLPLSEDKKSVNGDAKHDTPDGETRDTAAGSVNPSKDTGKNGDVADGDQKSPDGDRPAPPSKPKPAGSSELPPEVRAKLRKLEKLESTYPGQPRPFPALTRV